MTALHLLLYRCTLLSREQGELQSSVATRPDSEASRICLRSGAIVQAIRC